MQKKYFISLDIIKPWVEYCSQNFSQIFCSASFCRNRGQTLLLIACVLAPSGCSRKRVWLQRDVRKGTLVQSQSEATQNGE